jgi:hypothetical protein
MAVTIKRKSGNPGNSKAHAMSLPDISLADMAEGIKTSKDKTKANTLSLAKYNDKTETELIEFITPDPDKADRATHRLNAEQLEARLVLMHRMLIRKVSPEEIRKILGISVPMYYKLKTTLDVKLRLDVSKVDVPYLIGDTLALYDEVRSMALTISSSSNIKDPKVKLSAMAVALKAESDKNTFLSNCGVYSAQVVEQIIRGIMSTGNFQVIDGKAERMIDAGEVNTELFIRLKQYAKDRAALTASDILGDSVNL